MDNNISFYDEARNALLKNPSLNKKLFRTVPYYEALRRENFTATNPQFTDENFIKHSWLMGFLEYDEAGERYLEEILDDTTDIIQFMDGLFDIVEIWKSRKKEPKPREQRAQTNDIKSLEKALEVFEFLSLNGDTNPNFKSMANVYPERGKYCLKDVYNGIEWLKEQIEAVNGNAKDNVAHSSYNAHFQYCYNPSSYDKLEIAIKAFIRNFNQGTSLTPSKELKEIIECCAPRNEAIELFAVITPNKEFKELIERYAHSNEAIELFTENKELIERYAHSNEAIELFTVQLIKYLKTTKLL